MNNKIPGEVVTDRRILENLMLLQADVATAIRAVHDEVGSLNNFTKKLMDLVLIHDEILKKIYKELEVVRKRQFLEH